MEEILLNIIKEKHSELNISVVTSYEARREGFLNLILFYRVDYIDSKGIYHTDDVSTKEISRSFNN